jgi:hypothetical protein
VVKISDGSFSRGVHKVNTPEEFRRVADELFEETDLLLTQKFLPTSSTGASACSRTSRRFDDGACFGAVQTLTILRDVLWVSLPVGYRFCMPEGATTGHACIPPSQR